MSLCSACMALFLMPPVLSLRVSQPHDLLTLTFYIAVGLVLARTTPSKREQALVEWDQIQRFPLLDTPRTELSRTVAELMSSDLGPELRSLDFAIQGDAFLLPCTPAESRQLLCDILSVALQTPGIQRISIYGTRLPDDHRLLVVAQVVWPRPVRQVIITGMRDRDCHALMLPGWPPRWHANWFDNGYDRIFQISVQAGGSTTRE